MYIIPNASPWLTKNIEKYVTGDFSNEKVIRYNFWADCIRYTFKENKIEISEMLPDFDIKITEHSTGFDLMCEMNDVDLERFVDLFLKEMSLINKYDFDKFVSYSEENERDDQFYYIYGKNPFLTFLFSDLWKIFTNKVGFVPIDKMNFSPAKIFLLEHLDHFHSRHRYD